MSQDDDLRGHYGYASKDGHYDAGPTLWISAMFIGLFSATTIVHVGQALWWRRWFLLPTIMMGGLGEILGWAARTWSAKNPEIDTPFLIQISTTIISPTFLSAANFMILGQLILQARAERFSRLTPRLYSIIFVCADVVALVIQAVGGGIASSSDSVLGGHIMLAGIIIQLVAIIIYTALATEFIYHLVKNKPIHNDSPQVDEKSHELSMRHQLMLLGIAFSSLLLFIRAIYRTAELSDGWNGRIIGTEVYFNVLDGGMVVLSMFTINFFHPGFLLRPQDQAEWHDLQDRLARA